MGSSAEAGESSSSKAGHSTDKKVDANLQPKAEDPQQEAEDSEVSKAPPPAQTDVEMAFAAFLSETADLPAAAQEGAQARETKATSEERGQAPDASPVPQSEADSAFAAFLSETAGVEMSSQQQQQGSITQDTEEAATKAEPAPQGDSAALEVNPEPDAMVTDGSCSKEVDPEAETESKDIVKDAPLPPDEVRKEDAKAPEASASNRDVDMDSAFAAFLSETAGLDGAEKGQDFNLTPAEEAAPKPVAPAAEVVQAEAAESSQPQKSSGGGGADVDSVFAAFLSEIDGLNPSAEPGSSPSKAKGQESAEATDQDAFQEAALKELMNQIEHMPGIGVAANMPGGADYNQDADAQQEDPAAPPPPAEEQPPPPPPDAATASIADLTHDVQTITTPDMPLALRFDPANRSWLVMVGHGLGSRRFPAATNALQARRKALAYCQAKFRALEEGNLTSASADEEKERAKAAAAGPLSFRLLDPFQAVVRGVAFRAFHLLLQYAAGKSTFSWPLVTKSVQRGLKGMKDYATEVEQRCELHRPQHPFMLQFRLSLDRGGGAPGSEAKASFGVGNYRDPVGYILSSPSARVIKAQKHQRAQLDEEHRKVIQDIHQKHQQAVAMAVSLAQNPQEAMLITQRLAAEAQAMAASAAEAAADSGRWARRLERFAVFCGAQGREEGRSGMLQLEGLTVLPNEGGSNALPVLLLMAFLRPHVCGGMVKGGCSALCDLDDMHVRAVSFFGHSEETRWMLPITGARRLTLLDLQRANTLREAISKTVEAVADHDVDDPSAPHNITEPTFKEDTLQTRSGRSRPLIHENPDICRALGELLASVGSAPSVFEVAAASANSEQAAGPCSELLHGAAGTASTPNGDAVPKPAEKESSKPKRVLGDHWIDIQEEGGGFAPSKFLQFDAPLPVRAAQAPTSAAAPAKSSSAGAAGAASTSFFSFDAPMEALSSEAPPSAEAKQVAEEDDSAGGDAMTDAGAMQQDPSEKAAEAPAEPEPPVAFTFLPQLTLARAVADRADSLRGMQVEAKDIATLAKQDVKEVEKLVKELKNTVRLADSAMENARMAWNLAMQATDAMALQDTTNRALNIIRDMHELLAEMQGIARVVEEKQRLSIEREQRAVAGHAEVHHFWEAALKTTKVAKSKMNFQWKVVTSTMQHGEISRRTAATKADEVVRLANEKLQRWEDERQILLQEEAEAERLRQAQLRKQEESVIAAQREAALQMQRQQAELEQQQLEATRRRQEAIQWGRHLVAPTPHLQYLTPVQQEQIRQQELQQQERLRQERQRQEQQRQLAAQHQQQEQEYWKGLVSHLNRGPADGQVEVPPGPPSGPPPPPPPGRGTTTERQPHGWTSALETGSMTHKECWSMSTTSQQSMQRRLKSHIAALQASPGFVRNVRIPS